MNSPPKEVEEAKEIKSPSPPDKSKAIQVDASPKSIIKSKVLKVSRLNAALSQSRKAAAATTQKRLEHGKKLLRERIDRLQIEFEQMDNREPLVPLQQLLSPRKDPIKKRRMKPFSPRHSYKQPMLTIYSEMSQYNKLEKMAIPYDKPFYIPVAPNSRDNPLRVQSEAEIAKESADFLRELEPPTVASLRKGHFGAKSPLSKRLTRHDLTKMVSLKHQKEGFLEKEQFYENDLSASKRYGNKSYDPVMNLKEFEKAYIYKKDAANSAVTPVFFGFHAKKKQRVKIFVKEALENQVVEDLYFGEESAATLKKFLDILEKIEKKMATTKSINTFEKIFKQFDVDDSGELSRGEFVVGLLELGISVTPSDKKLLFHYFDPNNDGAITYGEFTWVINNRRSIASKKGKGLQFNAEVKTNKGSSKNLKADVEATQKSMQRLNVAVGENNPFFRDQKVNKQNKSTYDIKRYV